MSSSNQSFIVVFLAMVGLSMLASDSNLQWLPDLASYYSASSNITGFAIELPTIELISRVTVDDGSKMTIANSSKPEKIVHYHAKSRPTAKATDKSEGVISIPPSKMEVHYYEMWNHINSTIEVPEEYQNPFDILVEDENGNWKRPLTSLEILQNVLHDEKFKADFDAVETYVQNELTGPVPSCLAPDLAATRDLANEVVSARRQRDAQQTPEDRERRNKIRKQNKRGTARADQMWPYEEMMLSLPILNVGYSKVGSTTLKAFFYCLGFASNHGQNGREMFDNLHNGNDLFQRGREGNIVKAHAYTEINLNHNEGYFPQISLMDELHEINPDSTLVFNFRPIADWIHSMANWNAMHLRMAEFKMPGLIQTQEQRNRNARRKRVENLKDDLYANNTDDKIIDSIRKPRIIKLQKVQMAKWWCGHVLHMREYVKEYPSHDLIELDLYDTNGTSSLLYDLFQADSDAYHESLEDEEVENFYYEPHKQCWGQMNTARQKKKKNEKE